MQSQTISPYQAPLTLTSCSRTRTKGSSDCAELSWQKLRFLVNLYHHKKPQWNNEIKIYRRERRNSELCSDVVTFYLLHAKYENGTIVSFCS